MAINNCLLCAGMGCASCRPEKKVMVVELPSGGRLDVPDVGVKRVFSRNDDCKPYLQDNILIDLSNGQTIEINEKTTVGMLINQLTFAAEK